MTSNLKSFVKSRLHPRAIISSMVADDISTLVDIGCGNGKRTQSILSDRTNIEVYGIDVYPPELIQAKDSHQPIIADGADPPLQSNSVDCVFALDFIEHLEKEDGLRFLDQAERIARKQVLIFTPNGYIPQKPYNNNEFQRHKSGWGVSEFVNKGYKVTGVNGFKPFRGRQAELRGDSILLRSFSGMATKTSQPIAYYAPRTAYQIVATKRVDG